MATATELAELRRLIDEHTQTPYTDEVLLLRIDEAGDLRTLASTLWREKAATYAGLVDVREGNSDRKLSQLYKQALAMADSLSLEGDELLLASRRGTRTRPIERM